MKLYFVSLLFYSMHVNVILGAGSYGIAMAKHSSHIRNICSYIETAGNKCPKETSAAGLCQAGLCAMN